MSFKEFSTQDLIKWVDTVLDETDDLIFATEQQRNDMKKAFGDNQVTGKILSNCKNLQDVKNMISGWENGAGQYGYLKKQLWSGIEIESNKITSGNDDDAAEIARMKAEMQKQKEEEEKKRKERLKNQNDNNNNNNKSNKNKDGTIKISFIAKGSKAETLNHLFSPDDTVEFLISIICETKGIAISSRTHSGDPTKAQLNWKNKQMRDDATLGELGFKENGGYNPPVTMFMRVVGGAYDAKEDSSNKAEKTVLILDENWDKRKRYPDFNTKTGIKASLKPDCLMGYDSRKELRVEMPCGHVFAPKTIFRLAKMYATNIMADDIKCPMAECGDIWDYDAIVAAGDFADDEAIYFGNLFAKRRILRSGNFRECGGCGYMITLPDELGKIRVRCPMKECSNRKDFCWVCGQDWKGGGFSLCGNKDCDTMSINETLKNCEMIKPAYLEGMECPSLRACPRCLKICQWDRACKHIKCWGCKTTFCFVCLSVRDEKTGWPKTCGGHRTKCEIQKPQQLKS